MIRDIIPEGHYRLRFLDYSINKDEYGQWDRVRFELSILDGPREGIVVHDDIILNTSKGFAILRMKLQAMGLDIPYEADLDSVLTSDWSCLRDKEVEAQINHRTSKRGEIHPYFYYGKAKRRDTRGRPPTPAPVEEPMLHDPEVQELIRTTNVPIT